MCREAIMLQVVVLRDLHERIICGDHIWEKVRTKRIQQMCNIQSAVSGEGQRCQVSLWEKDTSRLRSKQSVIQTKKTHTLKRQRGGTGFVLILPNFSSEEENVWCQLDAPCPLTITLTTHTTNSESPYGELMAHWPATKDVPPRVMREFGLGSRFVTICSITRSTVTIRPVTTGVDCCSTKIQQMSTINGLCIDTVWDTHFTFPWLIGNCDDAHLKRLCNKWGSVYRYLPDRKEQGNPGFLEFDAQRVKVTLSQPLLLKDCSLFIHFLLQLNGSAKYSWSSPWSNENKISITR